MARHILQKQTNKQTNKQTMNQGRPLAGPVNVGVN